MLKGRKIYTCNDFTIRVTRTKKPRIIITILSHIVGKPVIYISKGALEKYDSNELESAIYHEIGHFENKHLLQNLKFFIFGGIKVLRRLMKITKMPRIQQEMEADEYVVRNHPEHVKGLKSLLLYNTKRNEVRLKNIRKHE